MNKEIISKSAQQLFFERGIKSVNMDDIASSLGISKKTIYNFFNSKDEIVEFEIEKYIENHASDIERIKMESKNAIDELKMIYLMNMEQHSMMKPIFISDIQRYYPPVWKKLEFFFGECITKNIADNIIRGQEEGLYRLKININFIANQYYKSIFNLIEYFSIQKKYSIAELEKEHIYYHINAIGTLKGVKYLDKLNFEE